jgi:hypothetical protein
MAHGGLSCGNATNTYLRGTNERALTSIRVESNLRGSQAVGSGDPAGSPIAMNYLGESLRFRIVERTA